MSALEPRARRAPDHRIMVSASDAYSVDIVTMTGPDGEPVDLRDASVDELAVHLRTYVAERTEQAREVQRQLGDSVLVNDNRLCSQIDIVPTQRYDAWDLPVIHRIGGGGLLDELFIAWVDLGETTWNPGGAS